MKARLTFCAGTSTVTGANFLLELLDKKILVDCGLEQGSEFADEANREPFQYEPSEIDFLLITHAHTDHIGRIPKLVKDGFKGIIYSTPATRDLAEVMLADTVRLLEEQAKRQGVLPLYEKHDVEKVFPLWQTVDYYTDFQLSEGITFHIKDAGHILGSAMYHITANGKTIVFTGDLGNSPSLFLRDTDVLKDVDYIVMESVYGDRNHESQEERKHKFQDTIRDTVKRNRTLLIPAFSLERTQDMLYEINELVENNEIGDVKVFIDSPLATAVTAIYKNYTKDFKPDAKAQVAEGDDLFDFPKLKFAVQKQDSVRIEHAAGPKIIIAGSGMSVGGRVVKHEKAFLPDNNTTILFVGYQVAGSLGRQIMDGAKKVTIFGESVPVKAEIKQILGYSSHKDSDHLIEFVASAAESKKPERVFVAMGEPRSALFLVQRLRDYLGVNAVNPKKGESVELDF